MSGLNADFLCKKPECRRIVKPGPLDADDGNHITMKSKTEYCRDRCKKEHEFDIKWKKWWIK